MKKPEGMTKMRKHSELTAFIPILKRDTFGEWIVDKENDGTPEHPFHMPFVHYTEAVDRFIETLYSFCEAHPEYEHTRYGETLDQYRSESGVKDLTEADVSHAEAKLVIALLIGAVRADRFCEGALLDLCKNGSIVRWLERLEAIDKEQ